MRQIRSHKRMAWVCRVLAVALVAPYVLVGRPAKAQATGTPSVYVLDFNNKTTVGGLLLGRVAAAQVSLQLSESDNWEVIPDAQVQRRIQELSLQPPYDRDSRVKIATGVDATAVVYGVVLDARVSQAPIAQAFVRLQVVVEDILTGVLINGSVAEGLSTPRMGYSGDADILLEEALGKAAFKAREFMDRFRLPRGTVLNTTVVGDATRPQLDALLNIGARQGVRRGMEMIVTRQRQMVGKLRVVTVDSDISTGRVTENLQGVKPEDTVRAIFNFSDFGTSRSALRADLEPAESRPVRLAAAGGTGAEGSPRVARTKPGGTFELLQAPQDVTGLAAGTPQTPPPVVIDEPETESTGGGGKKILSGGALRMMVGGLLVLGILAIGGRGGSNASRPDSLEANGFQYDIGAPGAFIRVRWDRPRALAQSSILGYVIWRSDPQAFEPQVVGGFFADSNRFFTDNEATRDVTAYDGQPGTNDAGSATTFADVPGIVPGTEYRYYIAAAYQNRLEDTDGDGMPDTGDEHMSPLSSASSWVTAISPAIITAIDNDTDLSSPPDIDLRRVQLEWQQTPGADSYVVWVSPNPNFPSSNRISIGPFRVVPVNQGGNQSITRTINADRGGLSRKRVVYFSIGAWSTSDRTRPKPLGAIFSAAAAAHPIETPPPPPGSGSAEGGKKKGDKDNSRGNGKKP